MRSVLRIAAGDMVSKALLVGINLYLIRKLAVDEYSHFTVLLNVMFLGYQLACGPLERLYIAEHERYHAHLTTLRWILGGLSAFGAILWLWEDIDLPDALVIFVGVLLLSSYQVIRIGLQQRLEFTMFSVAEVLKNGLWLGLLVLLLGTSLLPAGTVPLLALLAATLLALLVLKVVLRTPHQRAVPPPGPSSIGRVLWDTRYVIAYSLVGAVMPYLPVLMAVADGQDTTTATYGAAMRYQAILGMAVFAVNTVLLPQMAALGNDNQQRSSLMKTLKRAAPLILLTFAVIVVAIWACIPYVDQGKYPLLPTTFLILSVTPALSLIGSPYINILLIDGRARAVLVCMCSAVGVNLLAFHLLGGASNPLAAAIASGLAYLTITVAVIGCSGAGSQRST